jgi:hypothetical protein
MRKPAALFVAAFATVAGGGLAVAVEGSPDSSPRQDPPAGPPFTDMEWVGELPPGPPPHAQGDPQREAEPTDVVVEVVAQDETAAEDEVDDETVVEDEVDDDAGPPADTHGAAVSQAAHDCPHDDPEQTHGECVREVARDNRGHADDETETTEPEVETEEPEVEDDEVEGAGHQNSNGRGHERGRGQGHANDG